MTSTTHRSECSAAALYVALELSAAEWGMTMGTTPGGGRCTGGSAWAMGRP